VCFEAGLLAVRDNALNTVDSRLLEILRDLEKSLTYREFEFSKKLGKAIKKT